ncbi:arginine decarboxylase [Nannochloropsis oceanica]
MGRGLPVGLSGPFARSAADADVVAKRRHVRDSVWQHDLPEIPELDNLFAPEGPIQEAEMLAAQAFGGAQRTWFLVNGSTAGVLAALLAVVRRHQQQQQQQPNGASRISKVLLPRNVHKSAINGLILAGADPVFLSPVYDKEWDICHGIPIDGEGGLDDALKVHGPGGDIAAVLLVSPTYHGVIMDIKQAALLCARYKVPLIVDEAHGAHLAFLERDGQTAAIKPAAAAALEGALALGADLVVQSTHKTLTAVSQCAMMHAGNGPLVDEGLLEFVGSALQFVQSSSPNYVLLASLDGARWQLAAPAGEGRGALRQAQVLAKKAKQLLRSETPFPVLDLPVVGSMRGAFVGLDPLRVTVGMMGTGMSGFDADEVLIEEHGVYAELPASRTLTFAVGPGNVDEDVERLVAAFKALAASLQEIELKEGKKGKDMTPNVVVEFPAFDGQQAAVGTRRCGPREAYFTASEVMSTSDASIVGRASAETVCPYPPGIPVLLPGELITTEVLRFLQGVLDAGGSVTGCSDPSLGMLRVLCLE